MARRHLFDFFVFFSRLCLSSYHDVLGVLNQTCMDLPPLKLALKLPLTSAPVAFALPSVVPACHNVVRVASITLTVHVFRH